MVAEAAIFLAALASGANVGAADDIANGTNL
jgi:hypothetical protein